MILHSRLSNGSLSPRQIFFDLKRYENERSATDAGYWIIFELLWRDFFKFIAMKYGTRLFYARGLRSEPYVWKQDLQQFEAWKSRCEKRDFLIELIVSSFLPLAGYTGIPFVDANMREIMSTGWMSNRGRQNVASFLTKDLGIDWRFVLILVH